MYVWLRNLRPSDLYPNPATAINSSPFAHQVDDEEYFNPEYIEIDRVLEKSVTTDPATEEEVTYYLVKWNSLPYEDSTWELEQDVDNRKVEQFERFNKLPSEEEREVGWSVIGMFLYSSVSSPLDRLKRFTLLPLAHLFIPTPTRLLWEEF